MHYRIKTNGITRLHHVVVAAFTVDHLSHCKALGNNKLQIIGKGFSSTLFAIRLEAIASRLEAITLVTRSYYKLLVTKASRLEPALLRGFPKHPSWFAHRRRVKSVS